MFIADFHPQVIIHAGHTQMKQLVELLRIVDGRYIGFIQNRQNQALQVRAN